MVNGTCVAKELSMYLGVEVCAPDSMVASGHDGSLYVVYEKNKPLTSRSAISEAMKKDNELLADIRLLLKEGKIDIPDFTREAEKRRVNYLISNYCEYIEVKP